MKLMLIIISNEDANDVTKGLLNEKYFVTKLSSTGGLLHNGNTTLLVGVDNKDVPKVKEVVATFAKARKKRINAGEPGELNMFSMFPKDVSISGATIFVLNVDEYYKI